MKGKKLREYELNLAELRKLKSRYELEVWEFSRIHLRVVGKMQVDYWPSTGKAWETGSFEPARKMTVEEVCHMAMGEPDMLPEGAREHMFSLTLQ